MNALQSFLQLPIVSKTKESFETSSNVAGAVGLIAVFFLLGIAFTILYSMGASKLSYSYNIYMGAGSGTAFFYSVVCFLFSGFYYPFYAWFLNPIKGVRSANIMTGGRR